jgi:hypothetical protein
MDRARKVFVGESFIVAQLFLEEQRLQQTFAVAVTGRFGMLNGICQLEAGRGLNELS